MTEPRTSPLIENKNQGTDDYKDLKEELEKSITKKDLSKQSEKNTYGDDLGMGIESGEKSWHMMVQKANSDNHIPVMDQSINLKLKKEDSNRSNKKKEIQLTVDHGSPDSHFEQKRPSQIKTNKNEGKGDNMKKNSVDSSQSVEKKSLFSGSANTKNMNKRTQSYNRTSVASTSQYLGIGSPSRISIDQKKIKFYPELAKFSKSDELLFKFLSKDYGDPFKGQSIDPDVMDYQSPDFGFNNYMIFDDK